MTPDIQISDSAANRLTNLIASKDNPDLLFRIYIQGGGCSGFQYGFQFEDEAAGDDLDGPTLAAMFRAQTRACELLANDP